MKEKVEAKAKPREGLQTPMIVLVVTRIRWQQYAVTFAQRTLHILFIKCFSRKHDQNSETAKQRMTVSRKESNRGVIQSKVFLASLHNATMWRLGFHG